MEFRYTEGKKRKVQEEEEGRAEKEEEEEEEEVEKELEEADSGRGQRGEARGCCGLGMVSNISGLGGGSGNGKASL